MVIKLIGNGYFMKKTFAEFLTVTNRNNSIYGLVA
jgi:hypothetical protein